ncbi:hypothetical protein T552_01079 [Pneumocystis carinii B80]|uniref:Dystroglycan-type cadherin-like domain-containing protein n=1 Tax=Pneumocystis carinii (strain B80) TaxID=1408658 RepID=A0A0W4ZND0_PNEC8|nr:hypothetical protein T552_01079 [Pneumocystis carinii B80]KTW29875.1 hypothetical protein T552_01079 [Pneumocystis carinii B80]
MWKVKSIIFWIFEISLLYGVEGIPILGYPVNSQVPPVARVSLPFHYKFAGNTFYNIQGSVKYSVDRLPSWLHFNAQERTFSGTPSRSDMGAIKFNLIATDSTGSATNPVTFVVVDFPAPTVRIPVSQQLRMHGVIDLNGAYVILPTQSFSFVLDRNTFDARNTRIMTYYCVSGDNTPLPSWIKFDPKTLRIWGTAPPVQSRGVPPLYFWFNVIAADVLGFSGGVASFGIVVSLHHPQLGRSYYPITAVVGEPFVFPFPANSLTKAGVSLSSSEALRLKYSISTSSWLSYSKNDMAFVGTPSSMESPHNVILTIMDGIYGITIFIKVNTGNRKILPEIMPGPRRESLPNCANGNPLCFTAIPSAPPKNPNPNPNPNPENRVSTLPNINARVGEFFSYRIGDPSSLSNNDRVELQYSPSDASNWLNFNRETMRISGIPRDDGTVNVKIHIAYASGRSRDQFFSIHIDKGDDNDDDDDETMERKDLKWLIVGAVGFVSLFILLLFLYFCVRRSRKRRSSTDHRFISRPIPPDSHYGQWPTMDEKTWDEPHRLSAFNIFKSTSANGLSGFVAEVKEAPDNTKSSLDPDKKYHKIDVVSPYSIHVLPVKDEPTKKSSVFVSKGNMHPASNNSDVSSYLPTGPPGYGQPHRSWRRTAQSSLFWPASSAYDGSVVASGFKDSQINEPYSLRLVNDSITHSDDSSGVISNAMTSSTSNNSSNDLSRKTSDSKITLGSYSEDSILSKAGVNHNTDDNDTHLHRKNDTYSRVRPWSAHISERDSMDSLSLMSSEHSRNEFLCDETDNPYTTYLNDHNRRSRIIRGISDSDPLQIHIPTRLPPSVHTSIQSSTKSDLSSSLSDRKTPILVKPTMLDRPKLFEYSRSNRTNIHSTHSHTPSRDLSSKIAFV